MKRRHFQWPWTTPNSVFKVTLYFDAEYLVNDSTYRQFQWNTNREQCDFEWSWVTLSYLGKYSMTWSIARSLRQLSFLFQFVVVYMFMELQHCCLYCRWTLWVWGTWWKSHVAVCMGSSQACPYWLRLYSDATEGTGAASVMTDVTGIFPVISVHFRWYIRISCSTILQMFLQFYSNHIRIIEHLCRGRN